MPINSDYSIPSANQQRDLQSNATANEQRARDRAAQTNGLLATPAEPVVKADANAIAQFETNQKPQTQGQTSAYQALQTEEQKQQLSQQVKVDISV